MTYRSLEDAARRCVNRLAKAEALLEEAKKRDPGMVLLQHDKQTGDMAYIHKHPKSKDHVIYRNNIEGESGEVILHRNHVKEMLALLDKDKEKK